MHDGRVRAIRIALLGLLGAGWLLGLASQVMARVQTGYMDVWPPQILLGVLLCFGAGAAERIVDPVRRGMRRGAIAGMAIIAAIIVGYVLLTVLMWNPIWSGQDGETWWSLLIEAPFWIGVPAAIGAGFGALGWYVADRIAGPSWPAGHPG
jgi:hypothetical protein